MKSGPAALSISAVSRRTGIPVSTLRFYERELSGLFHIRKTSGGHRRYSDEDVERFSTVRRLTETEGLGLSEVRRAVLSRGQSEALREEVDRLAEALAASTAGRGGPDAEAFRARGPGRAPCEAGPPRRRRWLG